MDTIQIDLCHDALKPLQKNIDWESFQHVRAKQNKHLQSTKMHVLIEQLRNFPKIQTKHIKLDDIVEIGKAEELEKSQQIQLLENLQALSPWRKGPFSIFGEFIDSEWVSYYKWERLKAKLPELHQKRLLDIGSNNGYYLFRMAQSQPQLALGLEPNLRYWLASQFLHAFVSHLPLHTELMGWEELPLFRKCFDIVFCMGILYHHSDPIHILKMIHSCLDQNGTLIIETAGIEGTDPIALFPQKYYAGMSSWFYPTALCLKHWLLRSGFHKVEVFSQIKLTIDEQRSTSWATGKSLIDTLMPNNHSLTIEGYPAPMRFCAIAQKK